MAGRMVGMLAAEMVALSVALWADNSVGLTAATKDGMKAEWKAVYWAGE